MRICFDLLRQSGNAWPAKFMRRVARQRLRLEHVRDVDVKRLVAPEEMQAMNHASLIDVQQKWRDRVVCNARASQDSLRKTRNRVTFDFDAYALAEFNKSTNDLPQFLVRTERVKTTASHRMGLRVFVVPRIKNDGELFNWLFSRATLNFQLSRFAHCCVCDRWELKGMAGKRSTAVPEFLFKNGEGTLGRKRDCPNWVYQLPLFAAVCHRPKCKDTFQHVVRGHTPRRILAFKGLMGSPNSSRKIVLDK